VSRAALDSTVAQAGTAGQPHTLTEDLRGNTLGLIRARGPCAHVTRLPHPLSQDEPFRTLTMPLGHTAERRRMRSSKGNKPSILRWARSEHR
jgi:hypothetical protein